MDKYKEYNLVGIELTTDGWEIICDPCAKEEVFDRISYYKYSDPVEYLFDQSWIDILETETFIDNLVDNIDEMEEALCTGYVIGTRVYAIFKIIGHKTWTDCGYEYDTEIIIAWKKVIPPTDWKEKVITMCERILSK